MTDEQLLKRASRGDEAAFLLLYERHREAVFRFAYRMLGDSARAEDVTQDCFLSLVRKPDSFDESRAKLRTYLLGATRNLSLKQLRRQGQEVGLEEFNEEPRPGLVEEPLRKLLDEELAFEVSRAVAALPPLQREALVLFEYEEIPLKEIAAIVEADVGTVKARLHRARARLRRELEPYWRSAQIVVLERSEDERQERDSTIFH
ncbi:MAG TPA: RNA polymerase sigma factor [Pyrinomonadaceae bacterium]|nr:RNA polymerase sigma factor [Pyrinomonadaceae bacterium]